LDHTAFALVGDEPEVDGKRCGGFFSEYNGPMFSAVLLLAASLAQSQPVGEIQVVGNRTVLDQTILFHLEPLRDQILTHDRVESTFLSLWNTGLFQDVQFRRETTETGETLLIVEVEEKPWLNDVRFEGEQVFRTRAELREKLTEAGFDLRLLRPFGPDDARGAAAALKRAVGPDYEVTADLAEVERDRVDLILTVEKHASLRVETIAFVGNQALDAPRLLGAMQLKPSGWTTRLTRRDRFDPERLETDLEHLRDAYRQRGFLTVEVGPAQVEQDNGKARLTIPIREGPQYRTGNVLIEPGFLIEEETVRAWLSLTPEAPYNAVAVRQVRQRIENRYRDYGYGAAAVEVDEELDASHLAHLTLRVDPGRLHLFGRIEIHGNEQTRDRHLRQYLTALDMDRFNLGTTTEDVRRLTALGLVRTATPETQVGSEPTIIDVTYHVQELPRFEYFLGGGANGVQGASGALGLVSRDLLGRGETWSFDGELGNRLGNLTVGYRDPFSLGRRLTWDASFIRQKIDYPDETSDDTAGFSIRLFGPGGSRWRFQSGFQWAAFELTSTLTSPVPFLTPFLGQRFQTNRLNVDFGYEGRDQPIFATRGFQAFAGAEAVGGVLGGDVDLVRLRARAQYVRPLDGASRRHLISLRGRAESVWPFGVTQDEGLPRFERLFLGSEDDLRGFPIREVGPKTEEGVPIGGDSLVYGSLEYQYVFTPRARLVGFFDLGNVYASDLPETSLRTLRFDAGGELRLLAPFLNLPLRFGYGFILDRLEDEPRGRFFFALSARF
jgi:outer membrane protein insertion porin family